jgi:hypothetical protein
MRPYLKITRMKRPGGIAQVIENLPSNHEALSSKLQDHHHQKKGLRI